jgi:hypothetical protein
MAKSFTRVRAERSKIPQFGGRLNGTARARSSQLRGGEPYQDRNRKGHTRCQRHPVFLVQPKVHFHFPLLRPTGQRSRSKHWSNISDGKPSTVAIDDSAVR